MPQSLHVAFAHIVFSTKYRQPFIDEAIENKLFAYLAERCQAHGYEPYRVGGYLDHVHLLVRIPKVNIGASELLQKVKSSSSKWMKTQGAAYEDFWW